MRRHPSALLVLLVLLVLLTGACGGTDDVTREASPDGPVAAAAPTELGNVVALDDFAAIHLLTLGVTPSLAFDAFQYPTTATILAEAGVPTEPYGAGLEVERVVAADPDLLVGVSLPTTLEMRDTLERVADTTVVDYASTWDAQLAQVAAAVGREREADALVDRLADDLERLARDVAATENAGAVTTVLADNQGLFSVPATTGLGSVLEGAGLERPAAQQKASAASGPFTELSAENLLDHDGDVAFVLSGGAYDAERLYASPLWDTLDVARRGDVHEVSGQMWLGTSALSVDWVLDDLRAVLVEGRRTAGDGAAAARYRAFVG
jgi:iron complex transport system substrate-binding protein